jgi:tetratricopeptide (TPR) repeat protein
MGHRRSLWTPLVLHAVLAGSIAGLIAASGAYAADEPPLATAQRLLEAGRLYPAEQAARAAIDLEPESAEAHLLLGRILIGRTRFPEADASLSRAAELDSNLPGVDRELGLVRFEIRDFAGARSALERELDATPTDAALWMRLGLCELELGRPEQAARAFEKASADPQLAGMAKYNLGIARQALGDLDEARAAFEEAITNGLPTSIAERAQRHLAGHREQTRPFTLSAAAGVFYESAVAQPASDEIDRQPDGLGQIEAGGAYEKAIGFVDARIGYDFYQKLYFETDSFDLQSHTFNAKLARKFGAVSATLGYVYSINLLGNSQDRFLDFHEVRATGGMSVTDWWYASLSPGYRAKRFDQSDDAERDADTAVVGLLQLFPLGNWSRYMLVGLTYEYEDASAEFDYQGVQTQLAFHLPFEVLGRELPIDIRYQFRLRDYLNDASLIGSGSREDRGHSARFRLGIPIVAPFRLQVEYEFEDVDSQLDSSDRTVHQTGILIQLKY